MKLSEFDFELPEELIAQHPVEKRDTSRLMVVNRENGNIEHRHFYDILDYLIIVPVATRNYRHDISVKPNIRSAPAFPKSYRHPLPFVHSQYSNNNFALLPY